MDIRRPRHSSGDTGRVVRRGDTASIISIGNDQYRNPDIRRIGIEYRFVAAAHPRYGLGQNHAGKRSGSRVRRTVDGCDCALAGAEQKDRQVRLRMGELDECTDQLCVSRRTALAPQIRTLPRVRDQHRIAELGPFATCPDQEVVTVSEIAIPLYADIAIPTRQHHDRRQRSVRRDIEDALGRAIARG